MGNKEVLIENKNNRIGEENINTQNCKMKIIEYRNAEDIDVRFEDGTVVKNKQYYSFKRGSIKNPFYPSVCNIGYIGNAICKDKNGKPFKSYSVWVDMINRCYNEKYRWNNKSYDDCSVCEDWHCYENFKKWFDENYYEITDEAICLDKDILVNGNKIYSPSTCIFVPQRINSLFVKSSYSKGVFKRSSCKKYIASYRGKSLGYYNTFQEAFETYKEYKEQHIKQVADEYRDLIPKKLYDAMYRFEVNNYE